MKSYVFLVVIERDEDMWRAYVPALEEKGAAAKGHTEEEALKNLREVAQIVIEALVDDGEFLPATVAISDQPIVAVTV